MNRTIVFCVWLLSLCEIHPSLPCIHSVLPFLAEWHSIVCMYTYRLSIPRWWIFGCVRFWGYCELCCFECSCAVLCVDICLHYSWTQFNCRAWVLLSTVHTAKEKSVHIFNPQAAPQHLLPTRHCARPWTPKPQPVRIPSLWNRERLASGPASYVDT